VKLEFAKPRTFSYWIQGHFAGCTHPTEREEAIARAAWNAAMNAALQAAGDNPDMPLMAIRTLRDSSLAQGKAE
jgi:hypothetical protein